MAMNAEAHGYCSNNSQSKTKTERNNLKHFYLRTRTELYIQVDQEELKHFIPTLEL